MTTTTTERRISTNKLLMDILDFDKALFDNSNLSADEKKYFNSIINGFNEQIKFYTDWLDSDEARRIFYENEQYTEDTFEKIDEQVKEIANDTSLTADEIISRIYDSGLEAGADEIKRTKYYNDATKYGLHFLQSYNFDLISNINEDLKNHIRAEIFAGIAAGEGMPEVAKRILAATDNSLTGKTLSARQRAMMIARTETARAMTQGRLQSYANYGVREVKILTAGDENVCPVCLEAAFIFNGDVHIDNVAGERIHKITDATSLVPFHPLCRCSVMAYIRHVLGPNPIEDAQIINLTPLTFHNRSDGGSSNNFIVLTPDKIPNTLPKILQTSMLEFDNHVQNAVWEYGYIGNLTANNYGEFVTDKRKDHVRLRTSKKVNPLDKLIASHSHLGYMPFNSDDFESALGNINCRYMVVHTNNCIYIAEFESIAFANVDKIIDEVSKAYGMGLIKGKNYDDDIKGRSIWENYKNNNILNKYMKLVRIMK